MDKNKNKIDLLYSGMDEWKLQEYLTKKWRKENLVFEGSDYRLVCWELMFHSWEINDNRAKWNEISIDFIFYSIELAEFLCIELKNIIKGKRKLLLAYCQTSQRTIHFIEQYDVRKMQRSMRLSRAHSTVERGGIDLMIDQISFSRKPSVKRVLMARSFQDNTSDVIDHLNSLNVVDLKEQCSGYSKNKSNKEFERFNAITADQFSLVNDHPLTIIDIDI
tara:strand:+ start:82 stop:741 length:660 start_codon:yes stop_codon:yes gene_type:complete